MAWTDGDFKIFAAGLAIGGKYNHTHGTLPRVKSSVPSGTYGVVFAFTLSCDLAQATILYSVDGGTPTTVYLGEELYCGADMVCYAYAIYGQSLSPMSKFTYVIYIPHADVVEILQLYGTFAGEVSVALQTNTHAIIEPFEVPSFTFSEEVEVSFI